HSYVLVYGRPPAPPLFPYTTLFRSPEDLPGLAARQLEILEDAARAVRPGGTLVLAVCSLEPEEGSEVAARFLGAHAGFEPVPVTDRKSTRLNSSHLVISYAVFCLKK